MTAGRSGYTELGFVAYLNTALQMPKEVLRGIGEDCAVIRLPKGDILLATADMLVEGKHFIRSRRSSAAQIGYKAIAVNVSDIAAMGGIPKYALVSLGLPRGISFLFLKKMYQGMRKICRTYGVTIVGGDTNASDTLTIAVTMFGYARKGMYLTRSGARIGDYIFVTGTLGGSFAGKHLSFTPRLAEAQYLASSGNVTSMIDISDGLALDLHRLAAESDKGAVIEEEKIPLNGKKISVTQALSDGEDFELLFTIRPAAAKQLVLRWPARIKTKLTCIGRIVDKSCGLTLVRKGKVMPLARTGYTHF